MRLRRVGGVGRMPGEIEIVVVDLEEQALSALLAGAPQIDLSAERLTLVSSGHRAEFSRI